MSIDHRGGSSLPGHQSAQHDWVAPPPGAGRLEVCKHCARRKTIDSEQFACRRNNGLHDPAPVVDYDPYESL